MKPIFLNIPGHLINLLHVRSLEVAGNELLVTYRDGERSIPYDSEEAAEEAFAGISAALFAGEMTLFEEDCGEEPEE